MVHIKITSNHDFIKQLFLSDTFNSFFLEEATIKMANTFYVEGRIHKDFFSEEELKSNPLLEEEFRTWESLKAVCFDFIKGKKTPLYFKLVLHSSATEKLKKPEVKSYVLTIKFDGTTVYITTGISLYTFQLDKSPEEIWDSYILQLLSQNKIAYELES